MFSRAENKKYQEGNVVTLTLLGLSVAILAGVVVLYFIGKSKPEPVYRPTTVDEEVFEEDSTPMERDEWAGWNTYTNETYDFALRFPDGWVVATGTLQSGDPVISVYKAAGTSTDLVFGQDDEVSHVSIYPHGIATEGIRAEMKASDVIISVPQASAKDYVLKTGRAWATKGVFDVYPESWTAAGFVFARTKIEEEELIYMSGEIEIDQVDFDPFAGDHIERTGFIDTEVRKVQESILRSFQFTAGENTQENEIKAAVTLETPAAGDLITSPLLVQGSTEKGWYFGDDFIVQLVTNQDELITEVAVIPQDEGGDDTLRFEVSLAFETVSATSGKLIIGNSGLPEEISSDTTLVVPVLFNEGEDELIGQEE